jgi:hypothetical protein
MWQNVEEADNDRVRENASSPLYTAGWHARHNIRALPVKALATMPAAEG